jgi:hypothetical protein
LAEHCWSDSANTTFRGVKIGGGVCLKMVAPLGTLLASVALGSALSQWLIMLSEARF